MALYATIQSIVWGVVRHLGEDLSTSTLFFFRNFIGLLTIIPLISKSGLKVFHTKHIKRHLLRAFAALGGGLSIFYAVSHAPLATVVAITFAAPIFASLFAIYALGEVLNKTQLYGIAFGFLGVMIVLRPSLEIEISGLLSAVVAAVMTAIAFLTVKKLSYTESSSTVIAYPFLLILPISIVMAYLDWTAPKIEHIPLLFLMGMGISAAQYCMVKAFSLADASAVLPFDYLRLLVAIIVGSYFFNDVVDTWVVIGAAMILLSSLYIAKSGKKQSNQNRSAGGKCEKNPSGIQQNGYQVFHLNVFTQQIYSGNSATVVWRSNGLSTKHMQTLAREFNTPESIFVNIDNNKLSLRFYTPIQEVDSCGHGTIAAAYVTYKMLDNHGGSLVFNTKVGHIRVNSNKIGDLAFDLKFTVAIPKLEACIDVPKNIVNSLSRLNNVDIINAYIVDTGADKKRLLLHCKNKSQLLSITPNFSELLLALEEMNLFSVFVFSLDNKANSQVSARMFAPGIGINEDPVNGNSSVALACIIFYLCKNSDLKCPDSYDVHQGESVNRLGKASVHLHHDSCSILKVELVGSVVELYNYNLINLPIKCSEPT
jgi:PhzF family phenazine biosynthesis protein